MQYDTVSMATMYNKFGNNVSCNTASILSASADFVDEPNQYLLVLGEFVNLFIYLFILIIADCLSMFQVKERTVGP